MKLLGNILGFKLTWLSCVLGAANGAPWLGPLVLLCFFLFQRYVLGASRGEWKLIVIIAALGFVVDSSYVLSGVASFSSPWPSVHTAPIWIVAMWANYAMTLNHSLRWFQNHMAIGALFGVIGGPLAYIAGRALGGVEFLADDLVVIAILAIAWGAAVPITLKLARLLDSDAGSQAPVQQQRMSES